MFELDVETLAAQTVPAAKPVSRLPIVRRDLALVVDDNVPVQTLSMRSPRPDRRMSRPSDCSTSIADPG